MRLARGPAVLRSVSLGTPWGCLVMAGSFRGRPAMSPRHAAPRTAAEPARLSAMRITVLAGGVGAARFLRGLRAAAPDAEITVIGNTGDDITLSGLRGCADLDTVMYT